MLYIALLSGAPEVLQRRLAIAQELATPDGGRLSRLHTSGIEDHERCAAELLTHHLAEPVQARDRLRDQLHDIVEGRLGAVSKWQDPIKAYAAYESQRSSVAERTEVAASKASAAPKKKKKKKQPLVPPRASVEDDRRYRNSRLTLDDLRRPQRSLMNLYGSGVHLDLDRITVLNKLVSWFGKQKKNCSLAQGNFDGAGSLDVDTSAIDHTYVILVIDARNHGKWRQDAIAISPFAGAHAAYYVRSDVSETSWQDVLATGKLSARGAGARRLPFRGRSDLDQYESMELKLKALATCSVERFRDGTLTYDTVVEAYNVG